MTASSRGRLAIAALVAVLAFGAAFAVRKATAGSTHKPPLPMPAALSPTPVRVSGVALPATTLPALRHPPRPAVSSPAPTPATSPTPSPAPTPAAPAKPAAPSGGGGPVIIG